MKRLTALAAIVVVVVITAWILIAPLITTHAQPTRATQTTAHHDHAKAKPVHHKPRVVIEQHANTCTGPTGNHCPTPGVQTAQPHTQASCPAGQYSYGTTHCYGAEPQQSATQTNPNGPPCPAGDKVDTEGRCYYPVNPGNGYPYPTSH